MSKIRFDKMNGLGNDFVVLGLDGNNPPALSTEEISWITSRTTGIGCDQLILVSRGEASQNANATMKIYNQDATMASACGNAARCVIGELAADNNDRTNPLLLEVEDRLLAGWIEAGKSNNSSNNGAIAAVDFGAPLWNWQDVPLSSYDSQPHISEIVRAWLPSFLAGPYCLSVGNPHCVIWLNDFSEADILDIGPKLEKNPLFKDRANISLAVINNVSDTDVDVSLKVWERGAGHTMACGSAACAVAASLKQYSNAIIGRALNFPLQVNVKFEQGFLCIELSEKPEIIMKGSWAHEFKGEIDLKDKTWNYITV